MIDKEKLLDALANFDEYYYDRDTIFKIFSKINQGNFDVKESEENKKFQPELMDYYINHLTVLEHKLGNIDKLHDISMTHIQTLNKKLSAIEEIVKDEAIKTYNLQTIAGKIKESFESDTEITDTEMLDFMDEKLRFLEWQIFNGRTHFNYTGGNLRQFLDATIKESKSK